MSNAYKCDRCKELVPGYALHLLRGHREYELCPVCATELDRWLHPESAKLSNRDVQDLNTMAHALKQPVIDDQEVERALRCRVCFTHGKAVVHGLWEKCPWEFRMKGPEADPDPDDTEPKEL